MRTLRLIGILMLCCFLIGLSYLVVLRVGSVLWNNSFNPYYQPGIGVDRNSALFFAALLILLPYFIGGIFLGISRAARYALPIGLVTTIAERLLIFLTAAFVLRQFRQLTEEGEIIYVEGGQDIIEAIRSEALPYFDWGYILLGVPMSILVLYLTARKIEQWIASQIEADPKLLQNR